MRETKNHTVPVHFQYSAQYSAQNEYSTDGTDGNSFQDHHTTAKQVDPVHAHKGTSWCGPPAHCAHVHKSTKQVCRPGELLALRKVKHPHNGRTSVNRLPLTRQDILSHYSSYFEGIGHFPREPYKFHLKSEHKPARHAQEKFQSTLKLHLRRKSNL